MITAIHDDQAEQLDHTALLRLDAVFANKNLSRVAEGYNLRALSYDDPCCAVVGCVCKSHQDSVDCPHCNRGVMEKKDGCDHWFCGECGKYENTRSLVLLGVLSKCSLGPVLDS